ncbi:hypothetical protein QJQ45_005636 [Haematococcus lacustris]|nr:hypothetical protein QJQ45_005636 [Haematococcus lacustris]
MLLVLGSGGSQVDEVDDSRKTLAFIVAEMLRYFDEFCRQRPRLGSGVALAAPAAAPARTLQAEADYQKSRGPDSPEWSRPQLAVYVIHNKVRPKEAVIDPEVFPLRYFPGENTPNFWHIYPWDAPEISSHTAIAEAQAGAGWVEPRGQGLHDRSTHPPSDTALCSHPPPHASYPVPAVHHHRYWHQCPGRLAAVCPDALPLPVLGCSSGLSRAMREHYFRERPAELALAMQASSGLLPTHAASAAVHYADGGSTAAPVSVVSTTTPRLTPLQSAGGKPVSALTSALSGPVPPQQGEAAAGEGAVEPLPEAAMPRVSSGVWRASPDGMYFNMGPVPPGLEPRKHLRPDLTDSQVKQAVQREVDVLQLGGWGDSELERFAALLAPKPPDAAGRVAVEPISMRRAFWGKAGPRGFPHLAVAASRLLGVHATSAASERNWSAWGRLFTSARTRLTLERAKMLIYIKANAGLGARHNTEAQLLARMGEQRKDYEAGDAARERDEIFTGSSNDTSSAASETSFDCLESCGNFHKTTPSTLANAMDIKREVQRRGEAHLDPRVKELETDIKPTEHRLVRALNAELEEELKELERKLDAGRAALEKTGDLLCNLKLEVIERVLRDMDEQEAAEEVVPSKADCALLDRVCVGVLPHGCCLDLVEDLGREPAPKAQGLVGPTELLPTAAIWTSSTQPSTTTPPAAPPTPRAAVTGAGPDASPASSSPSNCAPKQHKTALHNSLMSIRLLKTFSALIDYVADDYIIIVTHSKDAWMEVEERKGQHCWAMFEGLDDTGYRRMMAAATALDQFFNCTPDGRVSDDELRIRQVLVGDQGGQLRAQEEAAASCVSWMTPEAQVELRAALDRETALNDAQRDTLQQAAARSFTLMQGPPGTGKSAALVSMVKALCRVFHCPTVLSDRPFMDLTGLWCANATKAKIQRVIAGHLEDDSELEHDAAMGAAEPCAAALLAALEEVKSNPPIPYKATNQQNMRIMVAAESNAAVDRLLAGLVDDRNFTGYTVTAPRLAQYSLEVKKSEHKLVVAVRQLKLAFSKGNSSRAEQDEAVDLVSRTLRWVATENEEEAAKAIKAAKQCTKTKENKLHEMGRMMEQLAAFDIVIRAHVVVGTCVALGELRKTQHRDLTLVCPIVLCDEAAQSSECASMVPLTLGAEWVLMAGDTKQLCPVLKSTTARSALRLYSSGGSLYGRLQAAGVMEGTLVMQYRMHPVLREFPSNTFYGGRLVEDPQHMPAMDLPKLGDKYPVAFFDLAGRQERGNLDARGPQSWRNEEEASVALRLMLLVASDPAVASIAILTPYTAQCSTINSLLDGEEAQALFAQYRERGIFNASACRAYTVDGYQGQEADVVILTTVRTSGSLGHVADPRRLNVAITRAKRGLLIVGCAAALSSEVEVLMSKQNYRTVNYWPRFIDHIKAKGGFVKEDQVQDKLKFHITLPMCLCTLEDDRRQSQNVHDYQQMTLMTRKHKGSRVPAPAPALMPAPIQAQA